MLKGVPSGFFDGPKPRYDDACFLAKQLSSVQRETKEILCQPVRYIIGLSRLLSQSPMFLTEKNWVGKSGGRKWGEVIDRGCCFRWCCMLNGILGTIIALRSMNMHINLFCRLYMILIIAGTFSSLVVKQGTAGQWSLGIYQANSAQ